jgi:hypothetical protein
MSNSRKILSHLSGLFNKLCQKGEMLSVPADVFIRAGMA